MQYISQNLKFARFTFFNFLVYCISKKYLLNCVAHSYLETHVAASDTSRFLPAGTKKDDQTQDTGGETQGAFSYKITKAPSGIGRCNTLVCESSLRPVGVVGCQANPTTHIRRLFTYPMRKRREMQVPPIGWVIDHSAGR